jgi:hypothetical protein
VLVRCLALTHADPKRTKRNRWVCRDESGLLHAAMIARFFDTDGGLYMVQASTACQPVVHQINLAPDSGFSGQQLPHMMLGKFSLVEYNVHEVPTCLQCWSNNTNVFG